MMPHHQNFNANNIENIEDTKTIYSIYQSNCRKVQSEFLKDSKIDFSIVIDTQDKKQNNFFSQNSQQTFKQKQQMSKKIDQIISENQNLKTIIKTLQYNQVQIKKDLQRYQKENLKQNYMKKVQSQNLDKNNPSSKQNKNKNQLLTKIGSLNLQLQREKRQKQTIINSFNQEKNNMIQQLKFMKQQNQLKQNRINQLNLQIINLQETIALNKKTYEKEKQQRQKEKVIEDKKLLNKNSKSSLNAEKLNKSQFQILKQSLTSQNTKIQDDSFIQYLLNFLMEKARILFQDNAVLKEKNKSQSKSNEHLTQKIKIIENENKKLKGQNFSFQSLINIQQQQISKMIKMHQSQFNQWTQIQSKHLQKKYDFFKEQNENLKKKIQQINNSKSELQGFYKDKIIKLEKELVQNIKFKQNKIQNSQFFAGLCGDLYSNLYSEYQRLKKINNELMNMCPKKFMSAYQAKEKEEKQKIKKEVQPYYCESQQINKIMKQAFIFDNNQNRKFNKDINQQQYPFQFLQIKKVSSKYQTEQKQRDREDCYSARKSSCIPVNPITMICERKINPQLEYLKNQPLSNQIIEKFKRQ